MSEWGTCYRWAAPYTLQVRTLLHRAIKTRRFEALSEQDFVQAIFVSVLAGPCLSLEDLGNAS